MSQHEEFEEYSARVLAMLDEKTPIPINLVPTKIVAALGKEPTKHNWSMCQHSLTWLEDNGYFKCAARRWSDNPEVAETAFIEARLTTLGMAALNRKLNFKGKNGRVGDFLREQLGKVGEKGRDAAVSELMKYVIGAGAEMVGLK